MIVLTGDLNWCVCVCVYICRKQGDLGKEERKRKQLRNT